MRKIGSILSLFVISVTALGQSALWDEYLSSNPRGQGSILANYSYAGYHYCEKELPTVDEITYTYYNVLDYGAVPNDDMSDRVAVVKTIEAAQSNEGKAVVYFPAGRFNLNGVEDFGSDPIVISRNDIVLKGAGQDRTELFFDQPAFLNSEPFIRLTPSYPNTSYWRGDGTLGEVMSFPERGGFQVNVSNADEFKPGMVVNVDADLYPRTEKGAGYFTHHAVPDGVKDREDYFFELHQVDQVIGNTVFFKEPIFLDLPHMQDVIIRRIDEVIEECGIEDLTLSGNYAEQFKHHNGSRFGERFDMISFQDTRNCWVRNVRIKDYSNAINLHRAIACSFFNINLVGHTGHNAVGGAYSNANLFMFIRENTQTHHGFGGDHSFVGSVFCRCNQFDGIEAHCAWPRASLYDLNMGGFEPRPGGAQKFPHHGKDLCFWNWDVTRTGAKDFWPDGDNYGYFMPPVIVGLHGKTFNIVDKDKDLLAYESLGTKVDAPESLFEAQLADRLGELPLWLKEMSDDFESSNRNASISIDSPQNFVSINEKTPVIVKLSTPDNFDKSKVKRIEIHLSKDGIQQGFTNVAEVLGWQESIEITPEYSGTIVLKALMFYGQSDLEESEPRSIYYGDPDLLNVLPIVRAAMLTHNDRVALYGDFTAVGGAEASNFPQNTAYTSYKNGSLFSTVEKDFYEQQLDMYAKFGQEQIKTALEKDINVREAEKLIDGNSSTVINTVYGYLGSMLQFDLGQEYVVGKVELVWTEEMSTPVKLEVQTSSDSLAWYSFVNDEPLWKFGVQRIGNTLTREELPAGKNSIIYLPQGKCRYIRFSAQNFPNGKLAEVRFYGTGIPLLDRLTINGASPAAWSPSQLTYEVTVEEGEELKISGDASWDGAIIEVEQADSYPGEATISVSDPSGATTEYRINIVVAGSYVEDFEKASSGSFDGLFVGNNGIQWDVEGRFSSSMGTGKCIYFYPTQKGLQSQAIPGGLSELAFDIENLTRNGSVALRVSVNDSVLIDSLYNNEDVFRVSLNDLEFLGDVSIKIENVTDEAKKMGIDNIAWNGYAPDRNAYLTNILLNDSALSAFDKDVFTYTLPWTDGMKVDFKAEAESEQAIVKVEELVINPLQVNIHVTAANGAYSNYLIMFDPSLSQEAILLPKKSIYPNPGSGLVYLSGFGNTIHNICVYNRLGKKLQTFEPRSNRIDLTQNPSGLSIIKVQTKNRDDYSFKYFKH